MKKGLKIIKLMLLAWVISTSCLPSDDQISVIEKKIDESFFVLGQLDLNNKEEVKSHLKLMYDLDQKLRKVYLSNQDNLKLKNLLHKSRTFYTNHIKSILSHYGWIRISEFGKEPDHHAWLIVQHADGDPMFQASCVFILQQLVAHHETDIKNFAYLYDRVALKFQHIGVKQKYGTQVESKSGKWQIAPYEGTIKDVNLARRNVGLEPIEQYLKKVKEMYK